MPEVETATLVEGKLIPKETEPKEVEITRELQVGIILTPNEAKNLAQWLLQKVEEYEKTCK